LQHISSNPSRRPIIDAQSEREFAMPITTQLSQVMKRDFQQYYRQPDYIMAKLSLGIVSGLFIGFSFWMSDNSNQGFQNTLFSLFLLCTIFSTMVNQ
jgi:ATP-binding cassette subfamily G (WHITE) protein 2 (PDR)